MKKLFLILLIFVSFNVKSQTSKNVINDTVLGVQLKLSSIDTILIMGAPIIKNDTIIRICEFKPSSQKKIILCFVNGFVVKQTNIIYNNNNEIVGKDDIVDIKSNENKL